MVKKLNLYLLLKYLGLLIDDHFSFSAHIQYAAKKLKPLLGFYVKPFSIIDHGDVLYMDDCSMPT